MTKDNPELSIPEIATLANVSERTVRVWFDDGKIRVSSIVRKGQQRRRFATKEDVEAFLASVQSEEPQMGGATSGPANTPASENC